MAIPNYLESLREKHSALAAAIQLQQLSLGSDFSEIKEMKKKKLLVKDEIVRLENPNRLTAPAAKKKKKDKSNMPESVSDDKVGMVSDQLRVDLKKVA